MLLKSAVFATVLAAAAAGTSVTASAAPLSAPGVLSGQQSSQDIQKVRWRTHTVTRCIRGHRVLLRMNRWGDVVSRRVVGRCWFPYRHHRHHRRHHWH